MLIKKTEKEYYIVVNCEELLRAAEKKGHENVILCREGILSQESLQTIKDSEKNVVMYSYYDEKYEYSDFSELWDQLQQLGIRRMNYDLTYFDSLEEAAAEFPDVRDVERALIGRGYMLDTDYTDRCGNCHARLNEKDKFCKQCGACRGEGKFQPFKNIVYCVYGPPTEIRYTCKSCGHSWRIRINFEEDESHYCPACGTKRIRTDEQKELSWDDLFEE